MNIRDAISFIKQNLSSFYNERELTSLINIVFEEILLIPKVVFLSNKNQELTDLQIEKLTSAISELKNNKPIQYIIGKTEFFGSNFFVDENVLIPRPETEELVDIFLKNEKISVNQNILDIGTGSGCIAVSVAKNSQANVFASDVSEEALNIAKKNANYNNVNIIFFEHNILTNKELLLGNIPIKFEYILSNPPYVRKQEAQMMLKNVMDYEPHLALFVENDNALIFYDAIANFAKNSLKKCGKIYLEINEYLAEQTAQIFKDKLFSSVKIENDIFDKKRFIIVTK